MMTSYQTTGNKLISSIYLHRCVSVLSSIIEEEEEEKTLPTTTKREHNEFDSTISFLTISKKNKEK